MMDVDKFVNCVECNFTIVSCRNLRNSIVNGALFLCRRALFCNIAISDGPACPCKSEACRVVRSNAAGCKAFKKRAFERFNVQVTDILDPCDSAVGGLDIDFFDDIRDKLIEFK